MYGGGVMLNLLSPYIDMLCVRRWSDVKPTLTIYRHALCTAVEWCRAGGQAQVSSNYREPKSGQQKVQLYYEDDPLCPSPGYIIYLLYAIHRAPFLLSPQFLGPMSAIIKRSRVWGVTASLLCHKKKRKKSLYICTVRTVYEKAIWQKNILQIFYF